MRERGNLEGKMRTQAVTVESRGQKAVRLRDAREADFCEVVIRDDQAAGRFGCPFDARPTGWKPAEGALRRRSHPHRLKEGRW